MQIQSFDEINESHAATGYTGRTDIPDFHIFTIEDTYPSTRQVMPPYRFNFYQIVWFENSDDAVLSINGEQIPALSGFASFASPDHVMAWVRGEAQRGYIIYFKAAFLDFYPKPVLDCFPYFRLDEINSVRLITAHCTILQSHYWQMMNLFDSSHPYRMEMLQASLLVILYEYKRLYDQQMNTIQQTSAQQALAFRFRRFVNQHYLTHQTVQAYADLLSVTPDHLGYTIKAATGKTALSIIQERTLLEAKKLLRYTELPIGEIANYLGYTEPTHFTRFFRRKVGTPPLKWRQQQP